MFLHLSTTARSPRSVRRLHVKACADTVLRATRLATLRAAQIQQRVARCNGDPHMSVQRPNCSKLLRKSLGSKNFCPTSMEFTLVPHQQGSFEEGLCKRSASFMRSRMSGYLGFPWARSVRISRPAVQPTPMTCPCTTAPCTTIGFCWTTLPATQLKSHLQVSLRNDHLRNVRSMEQT